MGDEKNEMLLYPLHLLLDPRLQNLTHAGYKPWNSRDLQKGHASWLVRWQRLPFELCRFSPGFSVAWLAGWVFFGWRFVFCTLPSLTLCLLSANANVCCLLSCLCCVSVFSRSIWFCYHLHNFGIGVTVCSVPALSASTRTSFSVRSGRWDIVDWDGMP